MVKTYIQQTSHYFWQTRIWYLNLHKPTASFSLFHSGRVNILWPRWTKPMDVGIWHIFVRYDYSLGEMHCGRNTCKSLCGNGRAYYCCCSDRQDSWCWGLMCPHVPLQGIVWSGSFFSRLSQQYQACGTFENRHLHVHTTVMGDRNTHTHIHMHARIYSPAGAQI